MEYNEQKTREEKQVRKQPNAPQWDKSHHSIFEDFALDLRDFTRTERLPAYGNQDVNYCLELQQERLQDKNLHMEYDMVPRGLFAEGGGLGRSWSDEHYISNMEYRTCRLARSFYREQKKIYEKKQDVIFYQIITNVHNQEAAAKDLYTCPNCGAVSQIGELEKGCPYCGTFFAMKDLFPKVTNFFFIRDSGATGEELKHNILKVVVPCMVVAAIGYTIYFLQSDVSGGNFLLSLINGIAGGIVAGGILGYLFWAVGKIGSLFKEAGRSMPMVLNATGSGKRFVSLMQKYSPEFSYEYFSDKVVSVLKMILYSKDAQELPNYVGEPVGHLFSDIVESSYTGAVALKQFRVEGENCLVTVDVYMEDIYDTKGRMCSKNDTFRIYLRKNISKPVDFHFSVKKIHCKGCGGSFDATKQRTCPSCGRKYEIEDDDWVVLKIQKR